MTVQQKTYAKITLVSLLILAALLFIYFKVIKPRMDKKAEQKRQTETAVITAAQTTTDAPATTETQQKISDLSTDGTVTVLGNKVLTLPG